METERVLSLAFLERHPEDAARTLERVLSEERAALLQEIPADVAAPVLELMVPGSAAACLALMERPSAVGVVAKLHLDIGAGLLRRLPEDVRQELLALSPAEVAAPLWILMSFPEGTAGAFMDPQILSLPDDISCAEALARVRRSPQIALYYLYVVSRERKLVGVLNLRELMLAPSDAPLAAAMRTTVAKVPATASREQIVAHSGWREYHALPVVDRDGALVGAIRYETLRRLEEGPPGPHVSGALATAVSLGELYWIGLSGVLEGLGAVASARGRGAARARIARG